MRYQLGESSTVLRKATYAAISKNDAEVGSRQTTDLNCLRASAETDKDVMANLFKSKPTGNKKSATPLNQQSNQDSLAKELERIVAKKSFFLNPHRNDPKIIKTKNRLYVI